MGRTKKSTKKFAKKLPDFIKRRKAVQKVKRRVNIRNRKKEKRRLLEEESEKQQAIAEQEVQCQIDKDDAEALSAARRNPLRLVVPTGDELEKQEGEESEEEELLSGPEEEAEEEEESVSGDEDDMEDDEDEAQITVTPEMLDKLEKDAHSDAEAFKRLSMIFRSACLTCDPEMNRRPPFLFPDAKTFNRVVTFCLRNIRAVLEDLLTGQIQERTFSDARLLGFMKEKNPRWQASKIAVNSFVMSSLALLNQMEQGLACAETLRLLYYVVPLYGAFPVIAKRFLRAMLELWASQEDIVRAMAFRNIHALAVLDTDKFLELTLKESYSSYIKHSQIVTQQTLPVQEFMRDSLVELFGISMPATYRLAFTSIRQIALHLRGVTMQNPGEIVKTVHNFQFLNALRVWADVFASHATENESIHHLLFPFIQVLLAAIDVSDGARLLGFRFHIVSLLIDVCEATGVFANPMPFLLQCLKYPEINRHTEKSVGRELDFSTHVVVPLRFLGTVELQETVHEHFHQYAAQFLAYQAYSIAFPEIALPFVMMIKNLAAEGLTSRDIDNLSRKVQENIQWVTLFRNRAEFSPKDVDRVKSFLSTEKEQHKSPLEKYWNAYVAKMEKEEQEHEDFEDDLPMLDDEVDEDKDDGEEEEEEDDDDDDDNDDGFDDDDFDDVIPEDDEYNGDDADDDDDDDDDDE